MRILIAAITMFLFGMVLGRFAAPNDNVWILAKDCMLLKPSASNIVGPVSPYTAIE